MRELTIHELSDQIAGGDNDRAHRSIRMVAEFNRCMSENWWENTVTGGVSGAIAGGVFGPGAVPGFIVGVVGGSTGTGVYCAMSSAF